MAGDDLLDNGQADACPLPTRLGGKEGFQHATGVCMGDARAVVDDGQDQPSISIPRPYKNRDGTATGASIAGVEEKIHNRVLEQARIAVDDRKIGRHIGTQVYVRLCEPMFDEHHRPRDKSRGLNRFGSRPIASGQSQQSANDSVNAVNLFKNDPNSTRRPLVTRKFGGKLLCPASDNPEGCRNLVRNAYRERAHDRCPSGAFQALVTPPTYVGDFQPVSQKKLLALVAQRQPSEAEHESARGRHTQDQAPARPALTIALAFGTGDRRNSPPSRGSSIHLSQTRKGRTDRKPKAASLGRF
ncbi:MAG TPA: hypothetical protein VF524_01070 [Polyangia bacterium]